MKTKQTAKYFCLSVMAVAVAQAVQAAEPAGNTVTGDVTAKLVYSDFTKGPGGSLTHFLESYSPVGVWGGNRDNGFYGDIDLNLAINDGTRDIFTVERYGNGLDNHRNQAQINTSGFGITGYFNGFRSANDGAKYLLNPNRTGLAPESYRPDGDLTIFGAGNASSGYFAKFNDGTDGSGKFKIDRNTFGLGMKLKPALLGDWGSIAFNYDGYKREGNKFFTTILGGGDVRVAGTNAEIAGRVLQRWWGLDQAVEENMHRFSLNLTASPGGAFQLAYDASLEKFDNKLATRTHADIAAKLDPTLWQYNTGADINRPLGFVPDSTLISHSIRLSKTFGATAVAGGYGMSRLAQDSQTAQQAAANWNGKISTENAFFNLSHQLSGTVGLEGFAKYSKRENKSPMEAADILDRTVIDEWGVRVASIDSLTYGLSARFSGLPAKSRLTVGWKHADIDRDLLWNDYPPASQVGQWPSMAMLRDDTKSDEFYLNWSARPVAGMTLRLTPSWVNANKTGYVTEAEKSFNLKGALGYALAKSTHLNAYYHYKDKKNGDGSFTDTNKLIAAPLLTFGTTRDQKADDTFHAAGVSLDYAPSEWLNLSGNLDWMQNDFETYFFGTNRRRFETQSILFDNRGTSAFKADTWSLSFNADYQPTDLMKYRMSYTYSISDGDMTTNSTAAAGAYQVNDKIDNSLHSLALGMDYEMKKKITLKAGYVYDYYKDKVDSAFTGGHHTLMMGVKVGF
jgi:hypothetical protein